MTLLTSAAAATRPFAVAANWQHRQRIERRVIGQLLQTLLYEDVLEPISETRLEASSASPDAADRSLFRLKVGPGRYRVEGFRCHSFALVRLDHSSLVKEAADGDVSPTLFEVLDDLDHALGGDGKLGAGFIRELTETLIKDLQSSTVASPGNGIDPRQLDADALEQAFTDAHSYHPSYKSRLGFSLDDNRRYGPEFGQDLRVLWLGVPRRLAHQGASCGYRVAAMVEAEAGAEVESALSGWLQQQDLTRDQVVLMPVHPWQWDNVLVAALYPELARGEIALLGEGQLSYRPQQSIRTLSPVGNAERDAPRPYLKLALGITNTSSTRILARHTITNGPIITAWLKTLVDSHTTAKASGMVILGEVAGVALDERAFPGLRHDQVYGQVGALWREHIDEFLAPGEQAVPFNGLSQFTRQPDGEPDAPFIADWIERHGRDAWTRQLVMVATLPIIHLLFAEGVGLESHGQNIVVIHRDGWPVRIALKDFHDGVRYSEAALARPELAPRLEPLPAAHAARNRNSFIVTDDLDAVRDYSCDAFFFIALAEMAIFLKRHFGLEEKTFWAMVADVIVAYQEAHPEHAERYRSFDVFVPEWEVEALTRRRLFGDDIPQVKRVPNPLAEHAPGGATPRQHQGGEPMPC
ncbi:IucA/IucC family siderophore biosynthesis protein [Halomonas sp. DP5Y7-2]|uniref:IucA/IucC family protein n=1 Tax=Halomonas sp. DP5Y7-2 TaxID=2859076 RepID=UPI001C99131F|nr:IucA/IucC family protein [Halomonas sp. DP5Y7-2]MBY5982781.1 IucA/IucC family siderophore biosynthesis protein [Halomonas sp. DP5Y7-2]